MQSTYNEDNIILAISAINQKQITSVNRAASTFRCPRTTLRRRRAGVAPRHDCEPNSKRLTQLEEEVIVRHILDLDSRGFAPTLGAVRDMADKLLAERGSSPVGKNWPMNFVKRTARLITRFNRPYDRQRALCEDLKVIRPWFELVQRTKATYGICDEDMYNFDETGFMMGKISSQLVVTGSERRNSPKAIQPGDREWVTVIQGINTAGWAIPPLVIFAGKYHFSAWYQEDIPRDWAIAVSDNGWTTNEIGVDWLNHFIKHTKDRTIGAHRLLILDGHKSHNSLEFQDICKDNNIITLCMPPHSSHLLQPLDVGCFSPLKRAYGDQINSFIRNHINHITKLEFLSAFKAAFDKSITKDNIYASFRGSGLVPFNPEAVLSKLDIQIRTPTPPPVQDTHWESKTPSNVCELGSQSTLIRNRIQKHQDSSPTSIIASFNQLAKGAELMMHSAALMRDQIVSLQKANEVATKRRERKKKRIQKLGTLSKAEGENLITQKDVDNQIEGELHQNAAKAGMSRQAKMRCTRCRETGHNSRTCKKDTIDST